MYISRACVTKSSSLHAVKEYRVRMNLLKSLENLNGGSNKNNKNHAV